MDAEETASTNQHRAESINDSRGPTNERRPFRAVSTAIGESTIQRGEERREKQRPSRVNP